MALIIDKDSSLNYGIKLPFGVVLQSEDPEKLNTKNIQAVLNAFLSLYQLIDSEPYANIIINFQIGAIAPLPEKIEAAVNQLEAVKQLTKISLRIPRMTREEVRGL